MSIKVILEKLLHEVHMLRNEIKSLREQIPSTNIQTTPVIDYLKDFYTCERCGRTFHKNTTTHVCNI